MMPSSQAGPPPEAAEDRQVPTGSGWSEYHRLVAVHDDGSAALAVAVGVQAKAGHDAATFHCAVFQIGKNPTVIADCEIVAPDRLWEFRSSGLWSDTICETPYLHWTYGLEAFALDIDNPTEMLRRGYGHRVPLGWELDFESRLELVEELDGSRAAGGASPSSGAFSQTGRAHGLLLLGAGTEMPFAGRALRQHWWGTVDEIPMQQLDDRFELLDGPGAAETTVVEVALPMAGPGRQWWLTRTPGGLRSRTVDQGS
jgi:hypothetical protein